MNNIKNPTTFREGMTTDTTNRPNNLPIGKTTSHFFDGFITSPKRYSEVCIYSCDARSYDKDDFKTRLGIIQSLKRDLDGLEAAIVKKYIAITHAIPQKLEKEYGLNRIIHPSSYLKNQSKKQLIENFYKYNWKHNDFYSFKSKKPILSMGVFNQYLKFNPRVYHFNGRFILRPNPSMMYSRSDTCHDLLKNSEITLNSKLKYTYKSKSCVLRKITNRTISDIDPILGISLLDFYRQDKKFNRQIQIMENNPEMIVLEIDHDYYNQGKNTTIYPIAACLVTPDISLDDIPEEYIGRFMKNSHINMNNRYERMNIFLDGMNDYQLSQLLPNAVEVTSLGLSVQEVSANRLRFGDGHTTNQFGAYDYYRSLNKHKVFKCPNGKQKIGIIPYKSGNNGMIQFAQQIEKELKSIGIDCEIINLEPYQMGQNNRLNQFTLREKYGKSDVDCALIELPEYSIDNWREWKNALSSFIPNQMITSDKMKISGASFNTTLGVASCLGSMPIGLDGNLTGIQIWIGMDIFSEGRKHIAAASTVCDAEGMLIGYPPSMVCSGERLDDHSFEMTLRIIMDGLNHHYGNEGSQLPEKVGLIRDGQFFENPNIISKIEKEYGVSFVVIDVKKQGAPKLASGNEYRFVSANCGTIIIGDNMGYIQTTGNGSNPGTPILRKISVIKGDVVISDILRDIFWLSKIHGGSTQQPGLPIPQVYAHKLAKSAGRGVLIPNQFNTDLSFL